MAHSLRYNQRVADTDLKKIAQSARRRIQHAIETRLATAPERYGVPLAGSLRGYSKLRVGDHRVIFRLSGEEVWILAVVHQREALRTGGASSLAEFRTRNRIS